MNKYPNRETVERIRREYPAGTRIEIITMDDAQAPAPGTRGTVLYVDDVGTIFPRWDSGGSLGVVYQVDRVKKVEE